MTQIKDKKQFYKMEGTGNSFILIFHDKQDLEVLKDCAKRLCHPKFGIGADGLLIIYSPTAQCSHYHMKILNQDGSYAQMCGNGLRCFCALLTKLNYQEDIFQVSTDAGIKKVQVKQIQSVEYKVKISMGLPKINTYENMTEFISQTINERVQYAYYMIFNVPHLVVKIDKSKQKNQYIEMGTKIQNKIDANINFIFYEKNQNLGQANVVTFQRGAGLTLACGTGVSSSFYVLFNQKIVKQRCLIKSPGGNIEMSFENESVVMNGPTKFICSGYCFI